MMLRHPMFLKTWKTQENGHWMYQCSRCVYVTTLSLEPLKGKSLEIHHTVDPRK